MPQGPKLYLLKLIEYNKIALLEKFATQQSVMPPSDIFYDDEQSLNEVQQCMTRLMR